MTNHLNDYTRSIWDALEQDEEFKAVRLILTSRGVKDPRFAAWAAGPIEGQRIISDWQEAQEKAQANAKRVASALDNPQATYDEERNQ